MTIDTVLENILGLLNHNRYQIDSVKPIAYGRQIKFTEPDTGVLRVYHGKKGITLDLSLIKSVAIQKQLRAILQPIGGRSVPDIASGTLSGKKMLSNPPVKPVETPLIGIDESGKGDFFGPLVIAGVYVDKQAEPYLSNLRDSKTIQDDHIAAKAALIETHCPVYYSIVDPVTYNNRYAVVKNLNTLLGHGHVDVMEALAKETGCITVLSDQFAPTRVLHNLCQSRGVSVNLNQAHRAESNCAVAAASIIARHHFLRELATLSEKFSINFPKGSGGIQAAQADFINQYGNNRLHEVAKIHFKCAATG